MLTSEQKSQFERDGFLVFERLLSEDDVRRMLERLEDIVEGRLPSEGIHIQNEPLVARGGVAVATKLEAVRKVERLAIHDDVFQAYAKDPRIVGVISSLLGPDLKLFRDALMVKPPEHGSAKPWHQDSPYWPIEPMNLVSVWIALDEANEENGCIKVIPGSHKLGPVPHVKIDEGGMGHLAVDESKVDVSGAVAVPLHPGGCLFFHSLLLHASAPNRSHRFRRGMIFSYMSACSRYTGKPPKPDYLLIAGREFPDGV